MKTKLQQLPPKLLGFYGVLLGFIIVLSVIFLILINPLHAATYYYISGSLNSTTSWKTNSNGTGTSPASFSGNNTFIIWNSLGGNISPTLTTTWNFGGTGTTILQIGTTTGSATLVIGTGGVLNLQGNAILRVGATTGTVSKQLVITPSGNLNITSGATTPLRVYNNATLTIQSSTFPASNQVSLNTGTPGSYVEWAQNSNVTIWQKTYANMIISGTGIKSLPNTNKTTRIKRQLVMNNGALQMANSTGATLRLSGSTSGTAPILTANSNLTIDGTGNLTLYFANGISPLSIRNLTINKTGGTLSFGTNLKVNGTTNFSNGILNLNNNTLTLSGPITFPASITNGYFIGSRNSSLVIDGTGTINNNLLMSASTLTTSSLYNLTFNRANRTLTLGNALRIWGEVTVTNGTLNTNGNLTIKADATQKGRIAPIGTNGDIIGTVTMEVFAKGGNTGWALLGMHGIQSQSFTAWSDDFPITCPTCPISSTFTSIYSYCESCATNNYSAAAHYVPMNSINDPTQLGTGYWVYLGTSTYTTNNIIIDATGNIAKKNFGTISLTRTGAANIQNGWNLIANPYPSPISFSALMSSLGTNSTNIDNTIYAWNPDLNGGNGDYAIYTPGIGSVPPVSSGGIDDNIPTGQGFFVHVTNNVTLNPNENWKTISNSQNNLLRTTGSAASLASISASYPPSLLILEMKGPNNYDVYTGIGLHSNATYSMDANYDAIQVGSDWPAPQIMSVLNNQEYKINTIPPVFGSFSVDIKAITGVTGTYTIFPLNATNFSNGACLSLYDKFTGITTNLNTNNYVFTLHDTTTVPRFVLSITNASVSATSQVLQNASCNNTNDGILKIQGSGYSLYNYVWKDAAGNVLATHTNIPAADTLFNVSPGTYFCEVSVPASCASSVYSFVVQATNTAVPTASFALNTPTIHPLNFSQAIIANNTSSNITSVLWELIGDGYTSTSTTFSYVPTDTGEYILRLHAYNSCNDESIFEQYIKVIPGPDGPFSGPIYDPTGTPIGTNRSSSQQTPSLTEPALSLIHDQNQYTLKWSGNEEITADIQITDLTGKILLKQSLTIYPGTNKLPLPAVTSPQWTILSIQYNEKLMKEKIWMKE
ncbi:MAG: hypothetical protein Fur0023_13790 [Bacteroidia bacterium]